jgi:flagellar biosynthesis protein FlhB
VLPQRPNEDDLWKSLASVAEAYGVPVGHTQQLANVIQGLDLATIPPELALAIVEALAYVYSVDEQADQPGGQAKFPKLPKLGGKPPNPR